LTVWLWDAAAPGRSVRGVTLEFTAAQRAARFCLEAGQAAVVVVQEAELVFADTGLESCYRRIGGCWQASRDRNGAVRWRQHPARMYDYLLGGKDNRAADREAAAKIIAVAPEIRDTARANRAFRGL
jgi:S-adenosyl methyltransferase